jgi:hypothetical protein
MTLNEEARIIAKAIHEHGQAMIEALEILDDTLTNGFAEIEEQLENIGDALRELEPDHKTPPSKRGRANST